MSVSASLVALAVVLGFMVIEGLIVWFCAVAHERDQVEAHAAVDEAQAAAMASKDKARIDEQTAKKIALIPLESPRDIVKDLLR